MTSPRAIASRVVTAADSDPGRVRTDNQDAHLVFVTKIRLGGDASVAVEADVAVVADGVGGTEGGAEAAQIAVEMIHNVMTHEWDSFQSVARLLEHAIQQSNRAINMHAAENRALRGMSTTIVVAVICNNRLYVAHVGDSRAYLIRNGAIYGVTADHTWVQEAVDFGRLTVDTAKHHPNRHVVTRYLGMPTPAVVDHQICTVTSRDSNVDVDTERDPSIYPEQQDQQSLSLMADDVILLCTDGLTDVVTDEEIERIPTKYPPAKAVRDLIKLANKRNAPDNITVVIMALHGQAPANEVAERSSLMLTLVRSNSLQRLFRSVGPIGRLPLMLTFVVAALTAAFIGIFVGVQSDAERIFLPLAVVRPASKPHASRSPDNGIRPTIARSRVGTVASLPATSTPLPRPTPIVSPIPSPVATRIAIPGTTAITPMSSSPTATRAPATETQVIIFPTPTPSVSAAVQVILLYPDSEGSTSTPVTFQVMVEGMQPEYRLQLLMGRGQDPDVSVAINWVPVEERWHGDLLKPPQDEYGTWVWTVAVVAANQNTITQAEARTLIWNAPMPTSTPTVELVTPESSMVPMTPEPVPTDDPDLPERERAS